MLLSEFQCAVDEWDLVLGLIEYIINHRPRDVFNGKSSIEVATGRRPRNALDFAMWKGVLLKDATKLEIKKARAGELCEDLAESLDRVHQEVRDADEARRRKRALKQARKPGMRFSAGDLVMVSAVQNAANIQRHSKLMVGWQGPYQVIQVCDATTLEVQNIEHRRWQGGSCVLAQVQTTWGT